MIWTIAEVTALDKTGLPVRKAWQVVWPVDRGCRNYKATLNRFDASIVSHSPCVLCALAELQVSADSGKMLPHDTRPLVLPSSAQK